MIFGCALYDDEKLMQGGWASIDGGDPFWFRTHTDLPTDIVFVTNGDWAESVSSGKKQVPNLRLLTYFRSSVKAIMGDLAVEPNRVTFPVSAQILSSVFSQTMKYAAGAYSLTVPPPTSLSETIANRLVYGNDAEVAKMLPIDLVAALSAAYQKDSNCLTRWVQNSSLVTIRRNRVRHAYELMDAWYPGEAWERVEGTRLPKKQAERMKFCLELDVPVLAKVSLTRMNSEISNLMAYGVTLGMNPAVGARQRLWMSHPELVWMSEYASVQIDEIYVGNEYRKLPAVLQMPKMFDDRMAAPLSYSAGLIAESHWAGLSTENWKTKFAPPRAVWMRSLDRATCYSMAKAFHDEHFVVQGYGYGGVTIRCPDYDIDRLGDFVTNAGFPFPVYLSKDLPTGILFAEEAVNA